MEAGLTNSSRQGAGVVSIDPALREFTRDGDPVTVEPLVFDLIVHLATNADRLITKDELVGTIWQGRAISDATLSSCIKAARRALGDDGQAQMMIRTVRRRGFRFIGAVEIKSAQAPTPALPAGLTVSPGDGAGDPSEPALLDLSLPKKPSVAVLPFEVIGDRDLHPVIAAGLARDITVGLSRTRWLFVTARASAARFTHPGQDLVEVGKMLGVRYLLHGSLIADGDRLRLTVALTDSVEEGQVWAERFDRRMHDVFEIQEEIANQIVGAVEKEIELKERQRAVLTPISSLDAWSAYHRARDHLFRFRAEDYDEAERLLMLASRLDPNSSRICGGLSFLHWQRAFLDITEDREGAVSRAIDFARQSVSLDPLDAQGHWVLGRAHILENEFEAAVRELQIAIDLNPNFAQAQYSQAFAMVFDGPIEGGLGFVDQARRISPYDPMTFAFYALRGQLLFFEGNRDEAMVWTARAVRQPNAHHHLLAIAAWVHEVSGDRPSAMAFAAKLLRIRPGYTTADFLRSFPFTGERGAMLESSLRRLGL